MRIENVLTIAVFACLAGCASQKQTSMEGVDGKNLRIEQVNKATLADYQYCQNADCPQRTIKTMRIEEDAPIAPLVSSDISHAKPDLPNVKKRVAKKRKKGGRKANKPAYKYVCVKQHVSKK